MTPSASEGIYYVILAPHGWQLIAKLFNRGEDLDHGTWWEEEVASEVSTLWTKKLGVPAPKLETMLTAHPYCFPRGRVASVPDGFLIVHGADLKTSMRVSKPKIEQRFGICGRCEWLFDEHEQCLEIDRDAVCEVLGVNPNWNAI